MKFFAREMQRIFKRGNAAYICGNGGSLSMASHFAEELVGKFEKERKALPVYALTNVDAITAIGNDYGFEYIFSRQIEAYGKEGDMLIVLTTSDAREGEAHSKNLLYALQVAKEKKMQCAILGSEKTNNLRSYGLFIKIPGKSTAEIQNNQLAFIHEVCREIDKGFNDNL